MPRASTFKVRGSLPRLTDERNGPSARSRLVLAFAQFGEDRDRVGAGQAEPGLNFGIVGTQKLIGCKFDRDRGRKREFARLAQPRDRSYTHGYARAHSLRYGRAARAALVVPWPQARKADDDPAAQSSVSRDGSRGRHQEGGDAPRKCAMTVFAMEIVRSLSSFLTSSGRSISLCRSSTLIHRGASIMGFNVAPFASPA
jgi:hypothetical protein